MKIIAFAGLGQAGKTTAAKAAAEGLFARDFSPVLEHFASPLKQAAAILGFTKGGSTDHLYREFCQWAGERARKENPDWFVHLMSDRLDVIGMEEADRMSLAAEAGTRWRETVVLIDDVRFFNERDLIRKYRGKTVFISSERRLTDLAAEWRKHISEKMAFDYEHGLSPDATFDLSISNNDPNGIDSFKAVISTMVVGLCVDALEEIV